MNTGAIIGLTLLGLFWGGNIGAAVGAVIGVAASRTVSKK